MPEDIENGPLPPADPVLTPCIYEESHSPNIHLWPADADPSFGKPVLIEAGLKIRFEVAEREFLEVSALVRQSASSQ